MSPLVDTNILLYAANPASAEHSAARAEIENLRRDSTPWFLTWGIVYEFLRVATHPDVFARPLSVSSAAVFIRGLMESNSLEVLKETDRHFFLLGQEIRTMSDMRGNAIHDGHIVVLMREHGIRTILTADKGFRRFKGIEVVDPVHH